MDVDKCELLAPHFGVPNSPYLFEPTVLFIRKNMTAPVDPGSRVDTVASMLQFRTEFEKARQEHRLLIIYFATAADMDLHVGALVPFLDRLAVENACLRILRVEMDDPAAEAVVEHAEITDRSASAVMIWDGPQVIEYFEGATLTSKVSAAMDKYLPAATEAASAAQLRRRTGPMFQHSIRAVIKGAQADFVDRCTANVRTCSTPAELALLERFTANEADDTLPSHLASMATSSEQCLVLAREPLAACNLFVHHLTRSELGLTPVNPTLAFDVSEHEAAKTAPAASVLNRFRDDVAAYAEFANTADIMNIRGLSERDIASFFSGTAQAEADLHRALASVRELLVLLHKIREDDSTMVANTINLLEQAANWVPQDGSDEMALTNAKTRFLLQRASGTYVRQLTAIVGGYSVQQVVNFISCFISSGENAFVWIEFLFGSLLSSRGEEDLLALNPFLPRDTVATILNTVAVTMLRANRLGHTNRCIGTAVTLEALLEKVGALCFGIRTCPLLLSIEMTACTFPTRKLLHPDYGNARHPPVPSNGDNEP